MDKHEYLRHIKQKERNTTWLRYGQDSLIGITRATADLREKE